MLSLESQIKYLWERRDHTIDPAHSVSSPVSTNSPSWLSLSGNVAFLSGGAGSSSERVSEHRAPFLLSSHCSLTKDHRMRFRGKVNESGDEHLKVCKLLVCQTIIRVM